MIERFFPHHQPRFWWFAGEERILRCSTKPPALLLDAPPPASRLLPSLPLNHRACGGLLLSFQKVRFTLLDFEDLPRRRSLQDQAVLWRLQRLLSDDLDDQILRWVPAGKGRILAALTGRSWLEAVVQERAEERESLVMVQPMTLQFWADLKPAGSGVLLERDGGSWQVSVRGPGGEILLVRRLLVEDEPSLGEEMAALKTWLERTGVPLPVPVWLLDAARKPLEAEVLMARLPQEGFLPGQGGPQWPGLRGWRR